MMAQSWAESTWDITNYGRFISYFPPNIIRSIRQFERINKKYADKKCLIYIYIYIYMCVCVCQSVYFSLSQCMKVWMHLSVCLSFCLSAFISIYLSIYLLQSVHINGYIWIFCVSINISVYSHRCINHSLFIFVDKILFCLHEMWFC